MANFTVLKGAALGKAITGQGKAIATFTAREHQIAYSAIVHLDLHNDVKYLNALYEVTPSNYRAGLRTWAIAFSKAKFDSENNCFAYDKDSGKSSKLDEALKVAPANYMKAKATESNVQAFDEVKYLERALKKLNDEGANPRVINAVEGALTLAKTSHLTVVKSDKAA